MNRAPQPCHCSPSVTCNPPPPQTLGNTVAVRHKDGRHLHFLFLYSSWCLRCVFVLTQALRHACARAAWAHGSRDDEDVRGLACSLAYFHVQRFDIFALISELDHRDHHFFEGFRSAGNNNHNFPQSVGFKIKLKPVKFLFKVDNNNRVRNMHYTPREKRILYIH